MKNNNSKQLKITIITPCYNSEATIKTTLESISKQNYSNLEYIVVDGASEDETLKICKNYDKIITKCISEKDKGLYDAMNKGVFLAKGEVIGILNSDDFYITPHVLNKVNQIFVNRPKLDIVFAGVDFVNNNNLKKPIRRYVFKKFKLWFFYFGLMPPHPSIFIRKRAYKKIGKYDLRYKLAADYDLILRMLFLYRLKFYSVNEIWVRMRNGGQSTSGLKSHVKTTIEMKRSLKNNNFLSSWFLLLLRFPWKYISQVLLLYKN